MRYEIGPHRLFCGDLTAGAAPALMGAEKADIVYSDPPWGPSNLKYWCTQNGASVCPGWETFLSAFADAVARYSTGPVFVEMGLRWESDLVEALSRVGVPYTQGWTVYYAKPPRPNRLLHFRAPRIPGQGAEGLHGEPVTRWALSQVARPGAVVLDPCCGRGMTARVAVSLGMVFRGAELNPKRLSVCERWLRSRVKS